jgi:hypothetical protein
MAGFAGVPKGPGWSELVNRYRIPETQTTHSYSGVYSAPSLYDIATPLQPSVTETGDNKNNNYVC